MNFADEDKRRQISRVMLAFFFAAAGAAHFLNPSLYRVMMPPWVPAPLFMIYLSGLAEIVLGILVLPEKTRRAAGWGLIALLAAVFPANLHLALNPDLWPRVPQVLLFARLPFQAVFMLWVWDAVLRKSKMKGS